jgi:sec-independent protein translocase protein TatA
MGLDNPLHVALLVILLLLVFGAKRLPEMGRSIGAGMREFKDSISGESSTPTLTQATQQQPPVQPIAGQAPTQPVAVAEQVPAAAQPAQAPVEPTGQA